MEEAPMIRTFWGAGRRSSGDIMRSTARSVPRSRFFAEATGTGNAAATDNHTPNTPIIDDDSRPRSEVLGSRRGTFAARVGHASGGTAGQLVWHPLPGAAEVMGGGGEEQV